MPSVYLAAAILLPAACGLLLLWWRPKQAGARNLFVMAATFLSAALIWLLVIYPPAEGLTILRLTRSIELHLNFDGMGRLFAGLIAGLWPLTCLYSLEYMEESPRLNTYYGFFLLSFSVTAGIAMAANLPTLYCFYEMLTLATVPLVTYAHKESATRAGRVYLVYSIGGAAFAFITIVFLATQDFGLDFVLGGVVTGVPAESRNLYLFFYLLAFLGFGVKAAMVPMCKWLPQASVAPTPVTALLHAVAVVKSGAFAIARLNWFSFGPDFLLGSWGQQVALCFTIATILYGSTMALRQEHFKLRLAYSTISNISYLVLGFTLLTPAGLAAGLLHMVYHGIIKVLSFFCAGSVSEHSGREYVREFAGLGRYMPLTFACFTVSSLALSGIPLFAGFVSKWSLLTSAVQAGTSYSVAGAVALLISSLFITAYMFDVVFRAFFPRRGTVLADMSQARDAGWGMGIPLVALALLCILFGVWSEPMKVLTAAIANGSF